MKTDFESMRGFTMIELLVVMIIIGIFAVMVPPMFASLNQFMELKSETSGLHKQLLTARIRAVSNPLVHCGVHFAVDSVPQKVMVFYDKDGNNLYNHGSDSLYMAPMVISSKCEMYIDVGDDPISNQVVIFRGNGSAKQGGRVKIKTAEGSFVRTIDILASTGRVKVIK